MPDSSSGLTIYRNEKVSSARDAAFLASNELESQLFSIDDIKVKHPIEIT